MFICEKKVPQRRAYPRQAHIPTEKRENINLSLKERLLIYHLGKFHFVLLIKRMDNHFLNLIFFDNHGLVWTHSLARPAVLMTRRPKLGLYTALEFHVQTFIKPADLQINLEAKSKPRGQNYLI